MRHAIVEEESIPFETVTNFDEVTGQSSKACVFHIVIQNQHTVYTSSEATLMFVVRFVLRSKRSCVVYVTHQQDLKTL